MLVVIHGEKSLHTELRTRENVKANTMAGPVAGISLKSFAGKDS